MSFGGFGGVPRKTGKAEPQLGPINSPIMPLPSVVPGTIGPVPGITRQETPAPIYPTPEPQPPPPFLADVRPTRPEVAWTGILHGVSGYAKANREILKRLALSFEVALTPDSPWKEKEADAFAKVLYAERTNTPVSPNAPHVTFLPPFGETKGPHRIIFTMMETERIHPNMIEIMNANYHECWTPTRWNAETFTASGLKIPVHVVPLGVDTSIYSPSAPERLPEATLLTGPEAGKHEVPSGFLFVYVFQPSFRKGVDVLAQAFEEAFRGDPEAGLILGITTSPIETLGFLPKKEYKSRIWAVTGRQTERQLASIYRACKVYVCTSRGEGVNLPVLEAAACGLPVIVPRTTTHPEIVPYGHGFFFEADSRRKFREAGAISKWFEDVEFADYGKTSRRKLVEILRSLKSNYAEAEEVAKNFSTYVRSRYTWEASAKIITDRILALR